MFISALTRTPCEVTNVQNDTDWLHFDVSQKLKRNKKFLYVLVFGLTRTPFKVINLKNDAGCILMSRQRFKRNSKFLYMLVSVLTMSF